jgi:hypothetical protein
MIKITRKVFPLLVFPHYAYIEIVKARPTDGLQSPVSLLL